MKIPAFELLNQIPVRIVFCQLSERCSTQIDMLPIKHFKQEKSDSIFTLLAAPRKNYIAS